MQRFVSFLLLAAAVAVSGARVDGDSLTDGPTQTYWWCEMHHAPQNIQSGSRPSNALVEASAAAAPMGTVDAAHAAPADLRTRVIAFSGPSVARGSGTQPRVAGNDPVPPQTFWCEMHQGADAALTAEDSQLSASLALLSKDALIARVVAAEGKVAKYRHKVQQIQDALADHS